MTGILFVLSLVVYVNENKRGTNLLSGNSYITGLNLEQIQKIELDFKNGNDIVLTKRDDTFVLEKHKFYPADSGKINDLIYKILSIEVKEQITSNASEQDIKNYELTDDLTKIVIKFYDNTEQETLSFKVGKEYHGRGNYLLKSGEKAIYLSANPLSIGSSQENFIDKTLLAVTKQDIQQIFLNSKNKMIPVKEKNKEKYADYLGNLVFEDYFAITDSEIRNLQFTNRLKVHLKNKLIYTIALAKKGNDHFIKIDAAVDETLPKEVVIRKENAKEDIKNAGDIFEIQSKARHFNKRKSNWVYKIYKSSYEGLVKS